MIMIDTILSSNIVHMAITFLWGVGLYLLSKRYQPLVSFIGYVLSFGVIFSFIFEVGEVYAYSYFYKRAFFYYSDEITTILILFFCYAVLSEKRILSFLTAMSIFLSGGKVSLVLLLIIIFAIKIIHSESNQIGVRPFFKYLVFGFLMYVPMIFVSHITSTLDFSRSIQSYLVKFETGGKKTIVGKPLRGNGKCSTISRCIESQIESRLIERYYGSIAGLWMTLKGGCRGTTCPNTPTAFASLMIRENPWGINDKDGLDFAFWKHIGRPQNPYLLYGAGYGVWILGATLLGILVVCLLAYRNLCGGEKGPSAVFSIFFIVIVVFNQTQLWLTTGSFLLATLGFCFSHIIVNWLSMEHGLLLSFGLRGVSQIQRVRP